MALTYKHPGVYVEEISTIPPSIAQVETAIPGFVGYTAKREKNGIPFDVNVPQRITSLLEFEQYFGPAYPELLEVTIENPENGSVLPKIVVTPATTLSGYLLYYHVKMFYENGGGPCFIISIGTFKAVPELDKAELKTGLDACEKEDEITLLVIPEIVGLSSSSQIKELNDAMLAQCARLQDRFAILDAPQASLTTPVLVADKFRNDFISSDNLKYGAAYYPQIQSGAVYNRTADQNIFIARDNRGGDNAGIYKSVGDTKKPITDVVKPAAQVSVAATTKITIETVPTENQSISIAGISLTFGTGGIAIDGNTTATAKSLKDVINAHNDLKLFVNAELSGKVVNITALEAGASGNNISIVYDPKGGAIALKLDSPTLTGGFDNVDFVLFNQIKAALNAFTVPLYPSGMMAGVMARVDNERGVWKAPANVSVRTVDKPVVSISDEEQDYLNVDPTGGKSINAIRKFAGRGTLIWGARTLAGNDNEWRYVPVRRLFIMVEESIKKATEFVVFEPNDAKTWLRVKTMCENFLNQLWRQGALAGAKPEHAYFVNVGLGITMTSLDILEGRLIIEIGMAAVRPAEFIILKFSHLLAKS
ncbi:phage tail sheath family protein [Pedobacter agri]|uniref:Phage tail sheath subtilisin-like domain-containing protein n=1 Tax=Pedobacter agri TaxID=454586 RepID=A0A9X3DE26_9SPHI|nr:phage tail sheath C-terminal domain-containing protein [Pedobacter agri]MCX3265597.1 phage tail sheath subtilisin-like domain-containing protein [Pedobacter agri]